MGKKVNKKSGAKGPLKQKKVGKVPKVQYSALQPQSQTQNNTEMDSENWFAQRNTVELIDLQDFTLPIKKSLFEELLELQL